ncbi:NAD(P)H-dependent oxidoreductase [Neobacillus ginsengisoli]|uniref:NAD(P)H dehydrogenase (Quinone) n=1 Tax=Neobacillus ginsengisoli TaxID=904295 RepID=A0ABT9XXN6_9BACI|nr:NAD(P)H-dependent oxidoreductase [Neobacillus ginsengisoli]MDQ0200335.1 NAD(P)H dehydrogenase (quinone) [Neobacillus ginsengisoli]
MKTLVIYTHPNPASFNAAIKETVVNELTSNGHEVKVRDLYAMNFNPILSGEDFVQFSQNKTPADIKAEQDVIAWADQLVFIYPTWWTNMPAMLKGYIDRVLTNGFAFKYTENGAEGLLNGKKAIIFQTTGQPKDSLEAYNLISPLQISMEMGTLAFTGIETIAHPFFHGVPYVSDEDRKNMLDEVKQVLSKLETVKL